MNSTVKILHSVVNCAPKLDYECPRCFLDFLRSMTLSMACSSCSSFSLLLSDLDFSFPLLPERLLFSELLCVELCNRNICILKASAVVVVT